MAKVLYDELFTDTDINTGEEIFYVDSECKETYSGIVIDYFKGKVFWEFEVRYGFKNGVEKTYYDTGQVKEINEIDDNTINGISKSFYKSGNLKSTSIVIRNIFMDTIYFNELGIKTHKTMKNKDESNNYYVETIFYDELGKETSKKCEEKKFVGFYLFNNEIYEYRKKYKLEN